MCSIIQHIRNWLHEIDNVQERQKRDVVQRDMDNDEHDYLEEWDKISNGITTLLKRRKRSLDMRSSPNMIYLTFSPGKFIKQANRKGANNPRSTYFQYHGSLTTPGMLY